MALKNLNTDRRCDLAMASKIASGDQATFAQFIDKHGPCVQALCRRYTATLSDCEDLIQEIFLALYKSIGSYRGQSSLSTWVYSVALNLCHKHYERRPQSSVPIDAILDEPAADDRFNPAAQAANSELKENVDSALQDLTPEQRDVVILHELQELTYSECASVLRIPVGTVKSRLYYAFRSLKSSLAGYVLDEMAIERTQNGASAAAETMI